MDIPLKDWLLCDKCRCLCSNPEKLSPGSKCTVPLRAFDKTRTDDERCGGTLYRAAIGSEGAKTLEDNESVE